MTDENTLIEMPEINLPAVVDVKAKFSEGFGSVYTKIEAEIAETPVDMSTQKGRDLIRSLAYKISQTKTGLDKFGKGSTEGLQEVVKAVNEERNEMRSTLDGLRDKVRAPLTEWENKEKEREKFVQDEFSFLRNIAAQSFEGVQFIDLSADQLDKFADSINSKSPCNTDKFGEAAENFNILVNKTNTDLKVRADKIRTEERERQELAALREKQEREEAERIERERKEAEEKRIAEEKERMAAEAARVAQREAQEKIDAERERAAEAEREKEAAIQAQKEAEASAEKARADALIRQQEAEDEAKRAALEQANRTARLAQEAHDNAEREKKIAAEKAEADKNAAIEEDRRNREAAERAERAAEEARAADLAHRKKINNAALQAIVKVSDVSEIDAKTIVKAIAEMKIPNIKINY